MNRAAGNLAGLWASGWRSSTTTTASSTTSSSTSASSGAEPVVVRNDAVDVAGIRALEAAALLVSPGPGRPEHAGVSSAAIAELGGEGFPVLGVCLGHQCIGQVFGGEIVRAPEIVHGKSSAIRHDGRGVFAGLPEVFEATRYHSLVVDADSVPDCLEVTAWTADGLVMGLRHRTPAHRGRAVPPRVDPHRHGRPRPARELPRARAKAGAVAELTGRLVGRRPPRRRRAGGRPAASRSRGPDSERGSSSSWWSSRWSWSSWSSWSSSCWPARRRS